jgi:hypothetical protein
MAFPCGHLMAGQTSCPSCRFFETALSDMKELIFEILGELCVLCGWSFFHQVKDLLDEPFEPGIMRIEIPQSVAEEA